MFKYVFRSMGANDRYEVGYWYDGGFICFAECDDRVKAQVLTEVLNGRTTDKYREEHLERLIGEFKDWVDYQKSNKPRIFTDENGKKYEVKEVKE